MPLMSRLLATVLATALPLSAAAQETLYFSAIPDEDQARLVERSPPSPTIYRRSWACRSSSFR